MAPDGFHLAADWWSLSRVWMGSVFWRWIRLNKFFFGFTIDRFRASLPCCCRSWTLSLSLSLSFSSSTANQSEVWNDSDADADAGSIQRPTAADRESSKSTRTANQRLENEIVPGFCFYLLHRNAHLWASLSIKIDSSWSILQNNQNRRRTWRGSFEDRSKMTDSSNCLIFPFKRGPINSQPIKIQQSSIVHNSNRHRRWTRRRSTAQWSPVFFFETIDRFQWFRSFFILNIDFILGVFLGRFCDLGMSCISRISVEQFNRR